MNERGQRIKLAMELRGIKKQYALAIDIGVDQSNLSRWCRGATISMEHAIKLCEALDVSLDWLLLGRGDIEQHKGYSVNSKEWDAILALRSLHPTAADSVKNHLRQLSAVMSKNMIKQNVRHNTSKPCIEETYRDAPPSDAYKDSPLV